MGGGRGEGEGESERERASFNENKFLHKTKSYVHLLRKLQFRNSVRLNIITHLLVEHLRFPEH